LHANDASISRKRISNTTLAVKPLIVIQNWKRHNICHTIIIDINHSARKLMLKIIIAPNALKGSLSAIDAANAIEAGITRILANAKICKIPIADGGDGLSKVLAKRLKASLIKCTANNPIGKAIDVEYLFCKDRQLAIIEMASAAGLALLKPSEYDPMHANTFGVGQMISSALDQGAKHIVLGIGGSASNDGGTGLANALGFRFLDKNEQPLLPGGINLSNIVGIDATNVDPRLSDIKFQIACDVDNPLLGSHGAAKIYGPQKGATEEQVEFLESGFNNFANVLNVYFGKDIRDCEGAGAAGGLGAGMMALFNAQLSSGADLVLELLDFEKLATGADLVITSEGKLDEQTQYGKAPFVIAKHAAKINVPCVVIAGQVEGSHEKYLSMGFSAVFSLCSSLIDSEQAMKYASSLLADTSENLIASFNIKKNFLTKIKDERSIMINKCLFPAAGYGTRFLPATKSMPKEILPILDKPLIQYGVEEAMDAGMKEIAIVTGRGKRALADHFDTNYELEHQIAGTAKEELLNDIRKVIDECRFSYTRQNEMRGLGDAILCGETLIGNEAFGVILADDLCIGTNDSVLKQMAAIYRKYQCSIIAISEVEESEVHKYGIIDGKQIDDNVFMVSSLIEKPDPSEAPSNLAVIGRYILTPEIFSILKRTPLGKNNELQLTDALQIQAQENMVLAYKFEGKRFDCGGIDGFVEATNYFYQKRLLKE